MARSSQSRSWSTGKQSRLLPAGSESAPHAGDAEESPDRPPLLSQSEREEERMRIPGVRCGLGAVAAVLAVTVAGCSSGGHAATPGPSPSTPSYGAPPWDVLPSSPPANPTRGRNGDITSLPDVFRAMIATIPVEFKTGKPRHAMDEPGDRQDYGWVNTDASRARFLYVRVFRDKTQAQARRDIAGARTLAGDDHDPVSDGEAHTGPASSIRGLGDEAFTFAMRQREVWNGDFSPGNDRNYDIGGTYVAARVRNVWFSVRLEGSDNLHPAPPLDAKRSAETARPRLTGTNLPDQTARAQATAIARAVIGVLQSR
ncbi:hypothetical protein AB0L06_42590 [Spirillospora sp. NPDC052269]